MKIWYQIKGRNIRLAVRRPVSYGRTASGDSITLIKFGHNNIFALYKNGEVIATSFDHFNAHKMWLDTITA